MKRTTTLSLLLLVAVSLLCAQQKNDPIEKKINALISKMTLEEKIGQMNQLSGEGVSGNITHNIKNGNIGSILNETDPAVINQLQRIAVEESRLGIPLIFARDVIHGYKTIFPIPLGQAASWNPEVAELGGRFAALEATAAGIRWTFAPMIDVTRDPRWGRIAESCGEDPLLSSAMGVAMIRGFQGKSLHLPTSMAACAKHFAAYGASEAGKDYNTTWVPETQLREQFLPPFEAAVRAEAASFMCSFNDINGVPSSGNRYLNYDILRKEWGYDGVLVSDWGSIEQMIPHGFVHDLKEAAKVSANARVDMDMMGYAYMRHLKELVASGDVKVKDIDEMVRNVLRMKFRLGLFDAPYCRTSSAEEARQHFYTPEALAAAKRAAIEGAVLLKNERHTLPVKPGAKVAIVGPLANAGADQVGTWCFDVEPQHSITPLQAIVRNYSNDYTVLSAPGLTYSRDKSNTGIANAITVAQEADVIFFFAGEEAVLSGEARCRADISLPGAQSSLLEQLKQTGKPIVLIVMAGRPLTIEREVAMADAVLYAFHGGTMAGPALADLLFGKAVPSGKLPITIPRMVGQIPIYYAHKNTGRPASNMTMIDDIPVGALQTSIGFTSYHLDAGDSPLFHFGYGLSYTQFDYAAIQASASTITDRQPLTLTCAITNKGTVDADEVVQLYVRDRVASLVRPVKELKGFQKIHLRAGETKQVTFTLNASDLGFWHADNRHYPEAGEFNAWIATDSNSGTPLTFSYKK